MEEPRHAAENTADPERRTGESTPREVVPGAGMARDDDATGDPLIRDFAGPDGQDLTRQNQNDGPNPESGPRGGGEGASDSDTGTGAVLGSNKMRKDDKGDLAPDPDRIKSDLEK
jgi:hypothetical protein